MDEDSPELESNSAPEPEPDSQPRPFARYGATWLDLVGTSTGRGERVERLDTEQDVQDWLVAAGLAPAQGADGIARSGAHDLRAGCSGLARATLAGTRPDGGSLRLVNLALALDEAPALRAGPTGVVITPPMTAGSALARVARQAAEQLTGPESARLRACPDGTCDSIFLDGAPGPLGCLAADCALRAAPAPEPG